MLHFFADVTLYDGSHVVIEADVTTEKIGLLEFRQCVGEYPLWSSIDGMITDPNSKPIAGDIVLLYSRNRNGQETIAGNKGD